ncbi:nicotinate (nicotinamide) nucleotide adenylyltransferase [Pelomonas sp. UHG3]|uniref:Nicotinate (Nicotinamide) nucleotide adenylyltransferase n=1 Tax=Roseateles hydrophilus TaxID=2975054 RepID=A0ACC6C5M7_9BURK|nr:nicotinate (nicotinamide) nucleotide adenylyltransferase [Pelomonas sp. UHG3]MCY4743723.1 nicotinate (nicotinamide) nucleotide adenylyltransferase [Pelomonas sp. UHG3]
MRLALFGGSFDPPHLGHLAFARFALEALAPQRLLWLPAGRQWQKPDQVMAAGAHRVQMLRLLMAGEPRFVVDDRELHRRGPSFTADTLGEFKAEAPDAELMFLIGQDQYARLPTWYRAEAVAQLATLVVVPRAGEAVVTPPGMPPHRLQVLYLPDTPISSTAVRDAIVRGDDICPLVGADVASYIDSHRLYGKKP